MKLADLIQRDMPPEPWHEGEKIPWNDPAFSQRMLKEHLTQLHDRASRQFRTIDLHVAWIQDTLLDKKPGKLLDLGCGPGFYTSRLARLGHICAGIDFGPASVDYAIQQAQAEKLNCTYTLQDVREAEFGSSYDLVMFLYGEVNVFRTADVRHILTKAYEALKPGGKLLLEPQTIAHITGIGKLNPTWFTAESGLFSDRPHIGLLESFWIAEHKTNIERYYIVDAQSGEVTRYAASCQAYTEDEMAALLKDCGFTEVRFYPDWPTVAQSTGELYIVTANKP